MPFNDDDYDFLLPEDDEDDHRERLVPGMTGVRWGDLRDQSGATAPIRLPSRERHTQALDRLQAVAQEAPQYKPPGKLGRFAGAALGAAAGWANAGGRQVVAPETTQRAIENVTGVSGHRQRYADWQDRLKALQSGAEVEQAKYAGERQDVMDESEMDLRQARMNALAAETGRRAKLPVKPITYAPGSAIELGPDGKPRNLQIVPNAPRVPVPGIDTVYSPDVFKQKKELTERPPRPGIEVPYSPDVLKQKRELATVGADARRSLTDKMIEAAAQSLAAGDLTPIRDISTLRGDQRLMLFNRVKELNPKFNTREVDRKVETERYFLVGKGKDNLQSFGIFLNHAADAAESAQKIALSDAKLVNRPINWLRENVTGSPELKTLLTSLEPVGKEFESFLLAGRALYADDRKQIETLIDGNSSLGQILATLKQMGHAAKVRVDEMNHSYKRVMGRDLQDPFSPEAEVAAKRIGVDLGPLAGGSDESAIRTTPDGKRWKHVGDRWVEIE